MTATSISMARAYMVDSADSFAEVGDKFGVSRQRVAQAVATVHTAHRRQAEVPIEFVRLTMFVPPAAVRKVKKLARELGGSPQLG
jgi:hypothetical protein